ncbi:hypothetical protein NRK67_17300 (plasmid) [Fusobacteria bacterium ZRK30]|nr:hypothetical protein NRK67_17300 [Fusobacteria bacterium ZRK30]
MSRLERYNFIANLSIGVAIFYTLSYFFLYGVDGLIYYDTFKRAFFLLIFGGKSLAEYHIFNELEEHLSLKYGYKGFGKNIYYFVIFNFLASSIIFLWATDFGSLLHFLFLLISEIFKIIIGIKIMKNVKENNMFLAGLALLISSVFYIGTLFSIAFYVLLTIIFKKASKQTC